MFITTAFLSCKRNTLLFLFPVAFTCRLAFALPFLLCMPGISSVRVVRVVRIFVPALVQTVVFAPSPYTHLLSVNYNNASVVAGAFFG